MSRDEREREGEDEVMHNGVHANYSDNNNDDGINNNHNNKTNKCGCFCCVVGSERKRMFFLFLSKIPRVGAQSLNQTLIG